ncbi:hypothetical protein ACIPN8_07375 [Streptomyces sp. NPDC086082]
MTEGIRSVFDRLITVHPAEPCFCRSLLDVPDDHRGEGLGMIPNL